MIRHTRVGSERVMLRPEGNNLALYVQLLSNGKKKILFHFGTSHHLETEIQSEELNTLLYKG